MFFALNEYGSDRLKNAYDTLPIDSARKLRDTARFLDVSERTLSNWLTGKSTPPRAVVYAIWHESPIGRAVTSAHSEHGQYLWRTMAKSQEQQVINLKKKIDTLNGEIEQLKAATLSPVAMNEPFFNRY